MRVWRADPAHALCFDAVDIDARELGWIVEHNLLVDALWRRIATCVGFETEIRIRAAQFGADGGMLSLSDGRCLRARLVIAADGAESQLRRLAGLEVRGWSYAQRAIVAHVETEKPHAGTAWQRFLDGGPLALLPLADGRASIVWSAPDAQAAELLALDPEGFCEALTLASERALGAVRASTERVAVPLQLRHAPSYFAPGIVLVGDAAHVVHPLAGQGVNLGFADVEALAATLSQARSAGRDWNGPRNLGRYARTRKARNVEMLAVTDLLNRGFSSRLPALRALLGHGLEAVNHAAPLKSWLTQRAVGL
jgi:ubiquinone biosynthesis UbiH/UbiF/VisC/COQ6 family hydroxylase